MTGSLTRVVHDFARVLEHSLGIEAATTTAEKIATTERAIGAPSADYWSQVATVLERRSLSIAGVDPSRLGTAP